MILFDDASLHGQFDAFESFKTSLSTLGAIRQALGKKGHQLRVCRTLRTRKVTADRSFNDFLGEIPRDLKNRLLLWLDREGPFWDDDRLHSDGEYFECAGELVTDSGAAEAACHQHEGTTAWLFSLNPSRFIVDPLRVQWMDRADGDLSLEIPNGWSLDHVERCASALDRPDACWTDLLRWADRECGHLLLSPRITEQLPVEFLPNVSHRSRVLLGALNQIIGSVKSGSHEEFLSLRKLWMEGEKARFTASSKSELNAFSTELSFKHPVSGEEMVCSWHGKIKSPQFRIHFEWPLPEGADRLFIAYIGPKITKR